MSGGLSTDFKFSNRIELSWLVQVLLNFDWFWGPPLGRGWWVGVLGWGWVWVCGACPMHYTHAHTHVHTCTCMHTCTHTSTCMLNMLNMDASMLVAICNFYTCIYCACVCIHVCVHVCRDTPHAPRCLQTPPPTCLLPRAAGSPKHQNSISLELIKIFQFCLKILYLWTLLNSYRL